MKQQVMKGLKHASDIRNAELGVADAEIHLEKAKAALGLLQNASQPPGEPAAGGIGVISTFMSVRR